MTSDKRWLGEWRAVLCELDSFPPVLQAILTLDAWNGLEVLQHSPWLGRLLEVSCLRQAALTTAAHLARSILGSSLFLSIAAGIAIAKPDCWPFSPASPPQPISASRSTIG